MVGDFNEFMFNEEKEGGVVYFELFFWDFRNMAENCKLKEVRFIGNMFFWGGKMDNVWVKCRLDRSFGNNEWFIFFFRVSMEYFEMWMFDYRSIRICFVLERVDLVEEEFFLIKEC